MNLITANPLRERLHRSRMLARYRCGRQSEALLGYQELRTLLADELGIDPGPPVQQLYQAVLAQDPDLDLEPPARSNEVSGTERSRHPRPHRVARSEGDWSWPGVCGVVALVVGVTAVLVTRSTLVDARVFPGEQRRSPRRARRLAVGGAGRAEPGGGGVRRGFAVGGERRQRHRVAG